MDLRESPTGKVARRHPWEVSRAQFFTRLLAEEALTDGPNSILDVGAGDAFFAATLAQTLPVGSQVTCCDLNYTDALRHSLRQTYYSLGLQFARDVPEQTYDLLILLDVLEHIPDDVGFLRELVASHLKANGHVLVSVPAWMSLFSQHDLGVLHYRRYRPRQLASVLTAGGLDIVKSGGLFHSLLLPRIAKKVGEVASGRRARPQPNARDTSAEADIASWNHGGLLTQCVTGALAVDNAVSSWAARRSWNVPGLSTWALCGRQRGRRP